MSISSEQRPASERRFARAERTTWALRGCAALLLGGSALAQSLVNGGAVRGAISVPGERDTYTFTAARSDWFELRVVDVDGTAFAPRIEVYNPRGARIRSSAGADVATIDATRVDGGLSQQTPAGTYTVVVSAPDDGRTQTGDYDLWLVLAPSAIGEELLDGTTVLGEIERGELDVFTFAAEAGQTVEGTITRLPGGTFLMRAEEFGPGGHSSGTGGGTVHFTTTTSPGGVHTIVVSDASVSGTGTGRYSLVVHGVSAAPPYAPSVFWPSELPSDPLLLDDGGHSGLGPRIGDAAEPFNLAIDCSSADAPSFYALFLTSGVRSPVTTPFGWLYLDGAPVRGTVGAHLRSVETWFPEPTGFPIPSDPALIGVTYTVQGACGGFGGSFRLSNAITQTIGG